MSGVELTTTMEEFVRRALEGRLGLTAGTVAKTVDYLANASIHTVGDTLTVLSTEEAWEALPVAFHIKRMLRFSLIAVLADHPSVSSPSDLVAPLSLDAQEDPVPPRDARLFRKDHSFLRPVMGDAGYGQLLESLPSSTPLSTRDRRDMMFLARTLPKANSGDWKEIEWWGGDYASARAMASSLGRPLLCFVRANLFGEEGGAC